MGDSCGVGWIFEADVSNNVTKGVSWVLMGVSKKVQCEPIF